MILPDLYSLPELTLTIAHITEEKNVISTSFPIQAKSDQSIGCVIISADLIMVINQDISMLNN